LRRLASRLGVLERVRFCGSAYGAELVQLLHGAIALIFPSLVEGFGLPVLEAMALGTPVVVSDVPALREVAGDAALVFDPYRPESLAAALTSVLDDERLGSRMSAAGRARARQFAWARTAEQTLAAYERVLTTRSI
jgi:glycosyltransferase involved in cell wall biosynthesis